MTAEATPRRVFVDTSAFFALASVHDRNHEYAVASMRRLAANSSELVTTNFIRAEAHALFLTRLDRDVAYQFLESLAKGSTAIIRVTAADENRAHEIIRQYADKRFSMTDAVSFAVMERLHLPTAFAFDRNFEQYGLTVL